MQFIAKQPYIKVVREVKVLEQKDTEEQRYMYLYEDKIVTKYREFPLENVMDISYRLTGEKGMLYLHTLKGVFAYIITSSPEQFIAAFKERTYRTTHRN
ncbi:hypothetical protein [Oceanobacillus locisalsi]|uniref:Bacterial Pleckstrin homology domain-containing protein n=1 Tax=Oceanobacillus locisalsi TaxID=546107 RepID=A0ABW3NAG1_9BACI